MPTYKTLLGSTSVGDGTDTYINETGSYHIHKFNYPGVNYSESECLQAKDDFKSASFSTSKNREGKVIGLQYNEHHVGIGEVYISNGFGNVIIFKEFEGYNNYPQPEQEVDPEGTLGKIIATWDLSKSFQKTIE